MNPVLAALGRRLRLGLVGGSRGFIGPVHRAAARLDDLFEPCAGMLSSDPETGRRVGVGLGLDPARCYPDVPTMVRAERARSDGIEVVAIMSPNADHAPQATACLTPPWPSRPASTSSATSRSPPRSPTASRSPGRCGGPGGSSY